MSSRARRSDLSGLLDELAKLERILCGLLILTNLVFPLVLFIAGWPKPWRAFDGEESPINWFSSLQCALLSLTALGLFLVTRSGMRTGTESIGRAWPWAAVSAGFLGMSLDEQFQGHERIRDEFLEPRGVLTDVDFLLPADIVLILFVLGGLVLGFYILPELRRCRPALIACVVGMAMIGFAAVQDALDLDFYHNRDFRHFQTIAEELLEIWAQLLFGLAFLKILFRKTGALLPGLVKGGER